VKARWYLPALVLSALAATAAAHAETPAQTYKAARAALAKGADNEAIDRLELLADQGVVSQNASLARAAAYLSRADGKSAQPGDLGRAAAALSEALLLNPDNEAAEHALEAVQAEIARRKSKAQENVVVRPRLGRAIAALLPEQAWAALAALCSLAIAAGVVLRRTAKRALLRLSGTVAIGVGVPLALGFGAGAYAAEQFRVSSQPAVVVVPEARLTNENGRPLPYKRGADTTTVPEGATVYVLERREGRCRVEWGSADGWLSLGDLRLLAGR
jgi:hypothetical protein